MNYCEIKPCDIANGDGVRVSLFVSGCEKHCKGCFNPSTWDPNAGRLFDKEACALLYTYLKKPYIKGLTLLGGDPFFPGNRIDVSNLLCGIKKDMPDKNIWFYTGYLFEDVLEYDNSTSNKILPFVDVVVDGPFIEERKDLRLKFRGSTNQRIIDVKESLKQNQVILLYK